jgi:hypothetical protein
MIGIISAVRSKLSLDGAFEETVMFENGSAVMRHLNRRPPSEWVPSEGSRVFAAGRVGSHVKAPVGGRIRAATARLAF